MFRFLGSASLALALAGCSGDGRHTTSLQLTLPDVDTHSQVATTVTCPGVAQSQWLEALDGLLHIELAALPNGPCTVAIAWGDDQGATCIATVRVTPGPDAAVPELLAHSCTEPARQPPGAASIDVGAPVVCEAPRLQLLYAIPGEVVVGGSTVLQVETANAVGLQRFTYGLADAPPQARFRFDEVDDCADGASDCREITCLRNDGPAEVKVFVTVTDDECADTRQLSIACHREGPACGNGTLEEGERCDDGNNRDGDGCEANCMPTGPVCGNGTLEEGERCDGSAGLANPARQTCSDACEIVATCGNGHVEGAEACDDGNLVDRDGCQADCTLTGPFCGDGKLDRGEQCDGDAGLLTPARQRCSEACRIIAICGNGHVEGAEACDDGNLLDRDGCQIDCTLTGPFCGDGRLDRGERCDGAAGLRSPDEQRCGTDCRIVAICGNGYVEGHEACDDGNRVDRDGCDTDCTLTGPYCGDGILDPVEACDGTAGLREPGRQMCSDDCNIVPTCGNGVLEHPETCDDGNGDEGDGCAPDCTDEPQCRLPWWPLWLGEAFRARSCPSGHPGAEPTER